MSFGFHSVDLCNERNSFWTLLKHIFDILAVAFCMSWSKSLIFSDRCQICSFLSSSSSEWDFNSVGRIAVPEMCSHNFASWRAKVMSLLHCLKFSAPWSFLNLYSFSLVAISSSNRWYQVTGSTYTPLRRPCVDWRYVPSLYQAVSYSAMWYLLRCFAETDEQPNRDQVVRWTWVFFVIVEQSGLKFGLSILRGGRRWAVCK